MLSKAWNYMKLNNMIEKGDRIVVGVSGGADSVCLLYVLGELCSEQKVTLCAVHINHGIRGKEAMRDEQFVKDLCSSLGVEFCGYFFDVKKIAKEQGLSEEEAGRKVRYKAFLETCQRNQCNKIAIAHNKNDNAETVLFHMFRGTGIRGLSGISPKRVINMDFGDITLIRPLLCLERKEIEQFLKDRGITYQIDSTNLTDHYSRNKIRNQIMTYVAKEINSGVIGNISEAASQLREIEEFVDTNIRKRYQVLVKQTEVSCSFSVEDMLRESPVIQKGIVLRMMENLAGLRKDLEAKHVEAILSLFDKQVGRQVHLPYRMIAEREYDNVKLYCAEGPDSSDFENEVIDPIKVIVPGRVTIPQKRKIFVTELINHKKNEPIPKSSCTKWFDYDKIENAVEIRTRQEGDYIQINDTGGNKKLKDYFIDHKIPKKIRDSQILITDGSHIMWIPGTWDRISEKYKVDETTTKVLLMKMYDLEENEDDR